MTSRSKDLHQGSLINLLRGWPNPALLPAAAISKAATAALADPSVASPGLLYGPDEGHLPCREAIAEWNTKFYRPEHEINKDRIAITGGASQNIGCILQVFSDPIYTRNVWLVAPSYFMVFTIFGDSGFAHKMRAVPEDEEGIDLDYLRREIQKSEDKAQKEGNFEPKCKPKRAYSTYYRHIIYCVPAFSNPSSKTMSLARRTSLVQLARDYDALLISDDVYDHLQWPASPSTSTVSTPLSQGHLPRLVDIDATLAGGPTNKFGNTISNGSFSKIVGPGIRVGWAEATPAFIHGLSQTGTTASGGAPSQLTSTYVTDLLKTGFVTQHIEHTLQPAYAARYATLIHAVEKFLVPLGVSLPQSERQIVGGYFVWLSLPGDVKAVELAERCKEEENVIIAPGKLFEVPGDQTVKFEHEVRFCLAWEDEAKFGPGVEKVAKVLERMLRGEKQDEKEKGNADDVGQFK